ncbi:MAG: MG2 domain-containing protein, partial [Phycisphaerales bacterium]
IHHDLTRSPQATVRVLAASLLPDADSPDRVRLTFDREMVAEDSVGRTEEAEVFNLAPSWPGKWVWSARDRLEYLLDRPLPAGCMLKLAATEQFKGTTGRTLEGDTWFQLAARPLRMMSCAVTASDPQDITFQVTFNQAVDPGDFLRHASFYDGKTSYPLDEPVAMVSAPQSDVVIRLRRPESNRLRMVLSEHLKGYGGDVGLDRPVEVEQAVSPGFVLLHAEVEMPGLEEAIPILLYFSQWLGSEQQLPQVAVEPAVEGLQTRLAGNALVATGKFKAGSRYTIRVPGTLLSADGRTLGADAPVVVQIPDYEPAIQLERSEGILSPLGRLQLDAKGVNLQEVGLQAWRVHANNLVPHLHWTDEYETSRSVLDKSVPVDLPHNQPGKLVLDLQELLSRPLGIYRIEACAADHRWTRDSAIVTITDLAITAKRHCDGFLVWVTSLRTAEPVSDVVVSGLTYNNQKVATAKTDAQGIAQLQFAGNHPDGGIWVITAAKDGDLSYLQPGENQWVMDDVEQKGRPYGEHYETMLYTDRGVYRPGETVHLSGVIRDMTGAVPSRFPLSVKVSRPDGRRVADLIVNRRERDQGMFHTDFTSSAEAQTGPYQFCVTLPGSEEPLGSTDALVEAFVPVRMEVTAVPAAERFGPNVPPGIQVAGRYLWDQPAADLPVQVEGTLLRIAFDSKTHPDFQFGSKGREAAILLPAVTGQLDERGQCEMPVQLPEDLKARLYRMRLSATVTEPGGRSVSSNTSATLDLLDTHVGLRLPKGQVVPVAETVAVDWLRLTGEDQLAKPGEMTVQLMRVDYDTVLRQDGDRHVWQSVEKTEKVGEDRVLAPTDSQGVLDIVCPASGEYRVIVTDSAGGSSTCLEFYASDEGEGSQSLAMNQPERVEVITDKTKYLPGEQAKVLLRSSIAGTVLFTIETDTVLAHQIVKIDENACELDVSLPADLRGSAFFTATVVRPVDPNQESWLPHRGLGTTQVLIDHASHRIPVRIDAPAKAQPRDALTVTVDAGHPSDPNQPALVHVWAVDEGILLAGAYETPELYDYFLGPRTSGVWTADVFYWLLPDYRRPGGITRIGGDGYDMDALRRSPVPIRTREPAVVWQEAVLADNDGKVTVQMQLPDLTGELRIMAVAVDQDRYGAAEHAMTLTAPLLMEASWPRFAASGDQFAVPVKFFNSTDRPLSLQIKADISGPIELSLEDAQKNLVVEPGRPLTRLLHAKATAIGSADVRIEAVEQGDTQPALNAHSVAAMAVRPATALHSVVELRAVPAGEEVRVEPPDLFMRETVQMSVSVSGRPSVNLQAALEEQIRYPYGCVEQTSSRLFSLLYASQILGPSRAKAIDDMVKAGIARLWSMQTCSGGLSYWPGEATPCLWGTAYAASCLLEARSAGYEIDPRFTGELVKYLESRLRATEDQAPDLGTKALICRVLATFGDPPHGWMARLAEQKGELDVAALAHLAGAFHAAGNKQKALSLLPDTPSVGAAATTTAGRLTSQIQQEAVWLSALLEIEPNHPMVAPLAASLDKARSNGQWGSTLNNAAVIAALARYQVMTAGDPPQFAGTMQTGAGEAVQFTQDEPASLEVGNAPEQVRISSTGEGTLYVIATSRGLVRDDLVEPYDRGLHIERRWLDREGNPVDANDLAVGDLVRVEIVVRANGEPIHNIAIVDALPGGLEVEDPRLATSAGMDDSGREQPDHVEFLDDRVVLFCTADSEPRTYRYALRAITAGEFSLPPIQGSCMYDPAVACLGTAGRVTIRNR